LVTAFLRPRLEQEHRVPYSLNNYRSEPNGISIPPHLHTTSANRSHWGSLKAPQVTQPRPSFPCTCPPPPHTAETPHAGMGHPVPLSEADHGAAADTCSPRTVSTGWKSGTLGSAHHSRLTGSGQQEVARPQLLQQFHDLSLSYSSMQAWCHPFVSISALRLCPAWTSCQPQGGTQGGQADSRAQAQAWGTWQAHTCPVITNKCAAGTGRYKEAHQRTRTQQRPPETGKG
jgi:hypothetical protein